MHECPACGQACDCDGEDHEQSAPDDCVCCALDACADCPHIDLCEPGHCLADPDDDSGCPACGGHGAHFAACPDLHTDCDD